MFTIENFIILFAAIYLFAVVYSLISQQKPSALLSISELSKTISERGSGWLVLTPIASMVALIFNFLLMSFWFLGVICHFIAWVSRWIWNEVILAGGYFLFSVVWHYLVKLPWQLLILAFGKILSSMKLNYLMVGALSIFFSLVIMFLGRYFKLMFEVGEWITYCFGVLAIIPLGIGISWIIQLVKGKSRNDVKAGSIKYITHLLYILGALLAIVLLQAGLVYIGTLTSFSSVFSSLFAGGNLLGSLLIILNSIVIIFSLGALPSFSENYQGDNRSVIINFCKYLINNNWGRYLLAAPMSLIPIIIACALPFFLTQGISYMSGQVSNAVFDARISQLNKEQKALPAYDYNSWLDAKKTPDDSIRIWKIKDLDRTKASLGILNTESTRLYLEAFYDAHSSEYAAAPVGMLFYLFSEFYDLENEAVSTSPLVPSEAANDTNTLNKLNSTTIPQINENIKLIDEKIADLNRELNAVCNLATQRDSNRINQSPSPESAAGPTDENKVIDECAAQRARITDRITEAKSERVSADNNLKRANEVAAHLKSVYDIKKSSNSNSAGSSKFAFLLVSLWLCLLIGLAFSPAIPIFAQVNHSVFVNSDDSELFVMNRIRSAHSANPNQPLLGVLLFIGLLSLQSLAPIPGIKNLNQLLPSLSGVESFLKQQASGSNQELNQAVDSIAISNESSIAESTVDTAAATITDEITADRVLTSEEVDETPQYTGTSFSYNGNIHIENGAPETSYEVPVSYIIEVDGSISDINTSSNNGFGTEEEIINALRLTSGEWKPAMKDGIAVRCQLTGVFKFPSDN